MSREGGERVGGGGGHFVGMMVRIFSNSYLRIQLTLLDIRKFRRIIQISTNSLYPLEDKEPQKVPRVRQGHSLFAAHLLYVV